MDDPGRGGEFSQIPAHFVGLRCPLDELERRERERGDRFPGIARAYADAVHAHVLFYDVEVDTAAQSADECARAILERVEEREPEAFKALCAKPGIARTGRSIAASRAVVD